MNFNKFLKLADLKTLECVDSITISNPTVADNGQFMMTIRINDMLEYTIEVPKGGECRLQFDQSEVTHE